MKKSFRIIVLLFIVMMCCSNSAFGWWNEQWKYRKQITFDTTAEGADIGDGLADVPILIRLHSGNFDFTQAKESGEDIRFIGANDTSILKHHIESFNSLEEIALIWVKVPQFPAGAATANIWMYYGNPEAMGGSDAKGTYDAKTAAVFHFSQLEGNPQDQTANQNHAADFAGGLGLPAVIGNGATFNGLSDKMVIANSPTLNFAQGFTFSAWIRIAQPNNDGYLLAREGDGGSIVVGIDGTSAYSRITTVEGQIVDTGPVVEIPMGSWHHLAVAAAPAGSLTLYLDGTEIIQNAVPGSIPQLNADVVIGASAGDGNYFAGELDELRISGTVRPAGWIKAAYASQGPEGRLLAFGVQQEGEGGGLPIFFLGTVMKNITLDGWVIIGILVLLSIASWIIMLTKSFFIFVVEKENKKFMEVYRKSRNPVNLTNNKGALDNSPLYRVYQLGLQDLKTWLREPSSNPGHTKKISPKAIDSIKASLERGFIQESKRVNAWLVVLTMAITGGPFLGLLGTVWGVMNTFAAMAEAGEANIMAIAPGVASALSTTVIGLIVAIPALFGYNYLTGKIKNIAADLTIFIDDFALKIDQRLTAMQQKPNPPISN